MKVTAVLFDLDGTLLPMEQEAFAKVYFGLLAESMATHGFEPTSLLQAIEAGVVAMVKNDGSQTNEEAFWAELRQHFGPDAREAEPKFTQFYEKDFLKVQSVCGFDPQVKPTVDALKAMGLKVILATNPIFPAIATRQRAQWTGLKPEDFLYITTYENSSFSKPNPLYYREILDRFGLAPEECLMVGNDAKEDMQAAAEAGLQVFLLPKCLVNKDGLDISRYPQGELKDLLAFVRKRTANS